MILIGCISGVDLGGGCGTIVLPMSASRWIRLLVLVGLVAFGAPSAHAQVFKPRGNSKPGTAVKATAPAPTPAVTPAANKKTGPATTTATAPAAATSKKPTRATGTTPRRVVTTTPKKTRAGRKGHDDGDTVVVDDDDDDVKITDE